MASELLKTTGVKTPSILNNKVQIEVKIIKALEKEL